MLKVITIYKRNEIDKYTVMLKKGIKYWLRWIGILPISLLAGILSTFPLHWILRDVLSNSYDPIITPYPELPERILTPFVMALTFVLTSFWIAPEHKFKTSVLFAITFILGDISAFFLIRHGIILSHTQVTFPAGIVPILFGISGAIVGIIYVRKKETIDNELS